jgi:hypothetical protein
MRLPVPGVLLLLLLDELADHHENDEGQNDIAKDLPNGLPAFVGVAT